ncbi:MAG: DUF1292 domain-containing protein [Firmicutes bacterium]|nr:DUF1292 domain-containing protein [Bacillota bacterium]
MAKNDKDLEKDLNKMLEEADAEDDTIVFVDDDGNEMEFVEIAYFDHKGKNYSALIPADEADEEDSEEECPLSFAEVVEDGEGYEHFEMIYEESLVDELFKVFLALPEAE